nr:acyltransferase [uncultured Draconibacterium sp.]
MRILYYVYKGTRKSFRIVEAQINNIILKLLMKVYNINAGKITTNGLPFFHIEKSGKLIIGNNFRMNNGLKFNTIGFTQPCTFSILNNARVKIGDNVGMSQTTIVSHEEIIIGDNVKLGGGVKIYDTDFHSLNSKDRQEKQSDIINKKTAPVRIGDNVFIGADSMILKGVKIGNNSIVGAGSIVSKEIPPNEIWGGNPASFIKKTE